MSCALRVVFSLSLSAHRGDCHEACRALDEFVQDGRSVVGLMNVNWAFRSETFPACLDVSWMVLVWVFLFFFVFLFFLFSLIIFPACLDVFFFLFFFFSFFFLPDFVPSWLPVLVPFFSGAFLFLFFFFSLSFPCFCLCTFRSETASLLWLRSTGAMPCRYHSFAQWGQSICSFLLQSVPGLCCQHKTRTYGKESGEEQI